MHPAVTQLARGGGEARPPLLNAGDVRNGDLLTGMVGIQARPLLLAELEEADELTAFAGGRDNFQRSISVRNQNADAGDVQGPGAPRHESMKKVYDVITRDHRVCEFDERLDQLFLPRCIRHRGNLLSSASNQAEKSMSRRMIASAMSGMDVLVANAWARITTSASSEEMPS